MSEEYNVAPQDAQTGVETTPVAEGAEPNAGDTQAAGPAQPPQDASAPTDTVEKAFAARLKQAQEKWERENAQYLQTGRELEQRGYDLETLRNQARQQSVTELVQQGWDQWAAQQYVQEQERAANAERRANDAALQAESARLAAKYGKDYDTDSVMAFAQARANETGEALTLETAYLIMNHESSRNNARRQGEQAVLAALQAGQAKGTETGSKGAGQKSIADMSDAEIEAISDRVRRGEKVKL